MDVAGITATLVVLAAHLVNKIRAFKQRIKERPTLLNSIIDSCEAVRLIAKVIEAQLKAHHVQANPQADKEEDPWHLLAITLEGMKRLLHDFNEELGDLIKESATTGLGRAILQLKTDDSIPRILHIQEQIHRKYRELSVSMLSISIQFALQ